MLQIKRLYTFIYQTFLPIFAMTFGICLFIFIIQFIWQHIDKLVGKGLDTSIILELFSYLALMLVPQVLPLAILLASLMTFGNMGERLELLAIKASGVSLMQIMKPMIVLISLITFGSFMFQNKVAPTLQVKVYSLLYSIQKKSPAINIPEGAFYSEMPGYSIYVKKKDIKTGMLKDVIIYDLSRGTSVNNIAVDVCDSAIMVSGDDRDFLTLTMYHGESFKNFKQNKRSTDINENIPFVREVFKEKEVIIPFKGDLERIDESRYDDSQLSKGLNALQISIDSMTKKVDSLNLIDRQAITNFTAIKNVVSLKKDSVESNKEKTSKKEDIISNDIDKQITVLNFDSVLNSYSKTQQKEILNFASSDSKSRASTQLIYSHIDIVPKPTTQRSIRLHQIFWHRMFSLPFACLIFFFIGAPLGSIIRKGGLGVPVIISVILFIIYYIIGNIGYKMARDGVWPAWQGEWLSAAVLFPLGVFLTYKSMNESALFNVELYGRYIRNFLRIKSNPNWSPTKEMDPTEIAPLSERNADPQLIAAFNEFDNNTLKDIVQNYAAYGYNKGEERVALSILKERNTYFFDVRAFNYDYEYSKKLFLLFNECSKKYTIPLYLLGCTILIVSQIFGKGVFFSALPITAGLAYLIFYIKSAIYLSDFQKTTHKKGQSQIIIILRYIFLLLLYPFLFKRLQKKMEIDLEELKLIKY